MSTLILYISILLALISILSQYYTQHDESYTPHPNKRTVLCTDRTRGVYTHGMEQAKTGNAECGFQELPVFIYFHLYSCQPRYIQIKIVMSLYLYNSIYLYLTLFILKLLSSYVLLCLQNGIYTFVYSLDNSWFMSDLLVDFLYGMGR
jgi:hypothetical protein